MQNLDLKKKVGVAVLLVMLLGAVLIVAKSPTSSTTDTKPTSTTKTYSMSEVAGHKSPTDCWTTINGNVYNVTPFINQHPGGSGAILYLCGINGTSAFTGQHGGQARPASELKSFIIGKLSQ